MVYLLGIICIAIPALACICELGPSSTLIERHHRNHDVYRAQGTFSTTLVVVMVFMGALYLLLFGLVSFNILQFDIAPITGFFATFMVVMFSAWLMAIRYQVVSFEDYLVVTPFVGSEKKLIYTDIVRMRRGSVFEFLGYHSLYIWDMRGKRYFIWGTLDVDAILLKINRFDVLDDR